MNNVDAVRAFLRGGRPFGRNWKGTIFWEGDTLYSYGYHWPLARKRDGALYINTDRYSPTTSRHMGLVMQEARRGAFRGFIFPVPRAQMPAPRAQMLAPKRTPDNRRAAA